MRACRTRTPCSRCSRCKMRQKRVSSAREVLCIASIAANVLTILRQILRYYAANVLSCYLPFLTLLWLHVGFVLRDAAKLLSILQEVFHEILRDAAPSKPSPPSPRKLSRCPASTSRRRAELRAGLDPIAVTQIRYEVLPYGDSRIIRPLGHSWRLLEGFATRSGLTDCQRQTVEATRAEQTPKAQNPNSKLHQVPK